MAKGKGGRPKKDHGPAGTRQIRVFEDLADMLGWIQFFREKDGDRITVAQIADPIMRAEVERQYQPYRDRAEKIKKLQSGAG